MSWNVALFLGVATVEHEPQVISRRRSSMFAAAWNLLSFVTHWIATLDDSIRSRDAFDVARCIALHNEILMHGWNGSGRSADEFTGRSWFDYHGDEASKIRTRLSKPLRTFLEGALTVDNFSFFYHVTGLSYPQSMWINHEALANYAEPDRYLTLYTANNLVSHPDGLVFDQWKNKAIIQMSIFDHGITHNLRQEWYPLDVVLSAWLDMIKVGKVQAVSKAVEPLNGKYEPWIMVPYSQQQLETTVQSFDRLVDAIESRMPPQSVSSRLPDRQHSLLTEVLSIPPLVSSETLDAACIPYGFAYSFLSKARRPSFSHIAPGLIFPSRKSLISQPFASVDSDPYLLSEDEPLNPERIYPILLFSSSQRYEVWADPNGNPNDITGSARPFSWPYSQVQSYPSGLYFTAADRAYSAEFEDAVRLVLPFPIGGFGYARTADGARFGENKEAKGLDGQVVGKDTFADLFQIGYNPFGEMHDVQLFKILDAWRKLVESGEWKVDKDGVQGSMEVWKDADKGNKWRGYVVAIGW